MRWADNIISGRNDGSHQFSKFSVILIWLLCLTNEQSVAGNVIFISPITDFIQSLTFLEQFLEKLSIKSIILEIFQNTQGYQMRNSIFGWWGILFVGEVNRTFSTTWEPMYNVSLYPYKGNISGEPMPRIYSKEQPIRLQTYLSSCPFIGLIKSSRYIFY